MTDAIALAEQALASVEGDAVEAVVHAERSALARFAGSQVHQPTLIENTQLHVRVVRDGAVGSATTNRLSADGIADAGRRAADAAASAAADPDFPGFAPSADVASVDGYDAETAALSAEEQATFARRAIAGTGSADAYGFFTSGVTEVAIASSTGLRAAEELTDAAVAVLAGGEDWSGYANATAARIGDVDPEAVGAEAAEKGSRTRSAREVEPGRYRAVLEPYAVADLLMSFGLNSFTGLGLLEGRSHFAGRLGERLFDPKVSIADDALDPAGLPKGFDFEGTAKQRVALVEEGVARGVVWDRGTAARAGDGETSTGHAPPPEYRAFGPLPLALRLAPGDAAGPEELADLVGDGLYVTRLHYVNVVDPRDGVITGMTRDGTFRIHDGRLAEPLVNLRFTTSVPELLADVLALGRELKLVNENDFYGERYPFGVLCPALATTAFTVTGTGSAPGL